MADPRVEFNLMQAEQALDGGNPEEALQLAKRALKLAPKDPDAWLLKAQALAALDELEEAKEEFLKLTQHHRDFPFAWLCFASFLLDDFGHPEAAAEAAGQGLAITGRLIERETEEQETLLALAADLLECRVHALLEGGKFDDALQAAEEFKSLAPREAAADVMQARCLFELARFDEAEKAAARALDKDPRCADALEVRAMLRERAGDLEGAQKSYMRAHSFEPDRYPKPIQISPERLVELAQRQLPKMPSELRSALAQCTMKVEAVPADRELDPQGGITATARVLMSAPGLERADAHAPTEMVLFICNLLRGCASEEELEDALLASLTVELSQFLGLTGDELDAYFEN